MDDDYTVINSLVAGGPAAKSKAISVGDRIVGVGQTGKSMVDVIGWRLDDVVALIKGPKGSKVRLEILPAGKGAKTRIVTPVSYTHLDVYKRQPRSGSNVHDPFRLRVIGEQGGDRQH